jgi:aryl-alcohol dehydrogenase-like predicted oxidoreductase
MDDHTSRRDFLAASVCAPAAATMLNGQLEPAAPERRALGRTGVRVFPLGFGCMTTSDPAVIERAVDLGINHFDTARAYQGGNNERMVGAALKGKRNQVIISSKSVGKTREEVLSDLDTSLRELGTDYLDIWYLHNRNRPEDLTDELFEVQQEVKKAGKIRFAGVSTHFNMPDMLSYLVKRGRTDVTLTTYNFTMKPELGEAIQAARRAGMGIVAMKVLAGGFSRIQRGDRLYGVNPGTLTETLKQAGAMSAAIKWVLKNTSVDTAIVCMTDFDQLEENLRAASEPFTGRDEKLLAAQLAYIRPMYCRMCGACGGVCPRGLPVADMLRILSYVEGYGQFAMARERYLALPDQVRGIRCRDCRDCFVDCPNGVEVRSRMIRAQDLFA